MKAITLHQPWATLIALGEKRIETRSWPTNYRGPIAIHAAKTMPAYAREFCGQRETVELLEHYGLEAEGLPLGAVLATAKLVDCVKFSSATGRLVRDRGVITNVRTVVAYSVGPDEHLYGDFSEGRFGFVLEDMTPLPEPIPARGFQGLWDWDGAR
jgi:hypothetical protein